MVIATAKAAGRRIALVLDDRAADGKPEFEGVPLEGPVEARLATIENVEIVLAVGDNGVRARLASAIHHPFATLIHPYSWVAPDVRIGEGTVVFAGTVIQPAASIGRHCILNTSCSIDHDCVLEDFVHVSPGAHLAGAVTLREGSHVGLGASVIQSLNIGAWSTVGAGAAVIKGVHPGSVVKGVPAR